MSRFSLKIETDETKENTIEELIAAYFPETIGTKNYNIQNDALSCYNKLIGNSLDNSPQSQISISTSSTGKTTVESLLDELEYETSIQELTKYARQNNLRFIKRKTPAKEKKQQIYVNEDPINYTILDTYYLFDTNTNCFYKMYKINKDDNYSLLSIIREITLHNYALFLKNKVCNNTDIYIPKIYDYFLKNTKINNNEYAEIIIKYELLKIVFPISFIENKNAPNPESTIFGFVDKNALDRDQHNTFKKTILIEWEKHYNTIAKLFDCFEQNKLFHNDSHIENVCFIERNGKYSFALIDFGKATLNAPLFSSVKGFAKHDAALSIESKQDRFETWINKTGEVWDKISKYGGKTRKYKKYKINVYRKKDKSKKNQVKK